MPADFTIVEQALDFAVLADQPVVGVEYLHKLAIHETVMAGMRRLALDERVLVSNPVASLVEAFLLLVGQALPGRAWFPCGIVNEYGICYDTLFDLFRFPIDSVPVSLPFGRPLREWLCERSDWQ